MKTKFLTFFNALLTFCLTLLGFSSCNFMAEYGVPYAELEVSGIVTNQENQRLEEMRVTVKQEGRQALPRTNTNQEGWYEEQGNIAVPRRTVDIIVEDPSGVYAPDSVRLEVTYDKTKVSKNDHWNEGKATVRQDFKLKKK